MDLLDNNILVCAFRPDHAHHSVAKQWLEISLNERKPLRLFPTIDAGFLRVVTHPKLFDPPSMVVEASHFLRVLWEAPSVETTPWTATSRERWLSLCGELSLSGNDCNDALLAAVALDRGLRLVTFDKGFRRFPNLKLELLEG